MPDDSEIRAIQFMQIYESLTSESHARLAALFRELVRSQEASSSSPLTEK